MTAAPGRGATIDNDDFWTISVPMQIPGPNTVAGVLSFVRRTRPFEAEDLATVSALVANAQFAAGELLSHDELRKQIFTDALTGLGNRRGLTTDLSRYVRASCRGSSRDAPPVRSRRL